MDDDAASTAPQAEKGMDKAEIHGPYTLISEHSHRSGLTLEEAADAVMKSDGRDWEIIQRGDGGHEARCYADIGDRRYYSNSEFSSPATNSDEAKRDISRQIVQAGKMGNPDLAWETTAYEEYSRWEAEYSKESYSDVRHHTFDEAQKQVEEQERSEPTRTSLVDRVALAAEFRSNTDAINNAVPAFQAVQSYVNAAQGLARSAFPDDPERPERLRGGRKGKRGIELGKGRRHQALSSRALVHGPRSRGSA